MRFSTELKGNAPSTLSINILAASSPTRKPRCSTVVSIGSHDTARIPLVKPQIDMSSGMR